MEPSWITTINTGTYDKIVSPGPLSVTVPMKGSDASTVTFVDIFGNVVTSTSVTSGIARTVDMPGGWKPGWYQAIATGPLNDPTVEDRYGTAFVSVWRNLGDLPDPADLPAVNADPLNGAGDGGQQNDLYLHGWTAMGPIRHIVADPADLTMESTAPNLANIKQMLTSEAGVGGYFNPTYADSARPRTALVTFSHDSIAFTRISANIASGSSHTSIQVYPTQMAFASGDQIVFIWNDNSQTVTLSAGAAAGATTLSVNSFTANATYPDGAYTINKTKWAGGITQAVSELSAAPYNVTRFEGLNEPQGEKGLAQDESAIVYNILRAAVHAGNPSAKAMGPAEVTCFVNGGTYGGALNTVSLQLFLNNVTPGTLDAFSGHFYNSYLDPLAWARTLAETRSVLSAAGYPNLELWVSEGPSVLATNWGMTDLGRCVQSVMWFYLVGEQYGLVKEHCAFFYDNSHGFNAFQSWVKEAGSLYPAATGMRVRSEEIFGKAYDTALSFGTLGTGFFFGNILRGSNGTCVEIITQGNIYDEVTLNVSDTGTITYSDWQGRTSTVTVSGGKITVPVGPLPTYVRLSAACTVSADSSLSKVVGGTNVATTATAVSGTGASNVSRIKDGTFQTGGVNGTFDTSGTAFRDTSALGANSYVELQWGSAQTIASVAWRGLPAWQGNASAITAAKLEYWDGTTWQACPTVDKGHWDKNGRYLNHTATSMSLWNPEGAFYNALSDRFTSWDYQWSYSAPLRVPVTTTRIRLTVLDTTYGHNPDSTGQSVGPQMFMISELCAFTGTAPSSTGPGGGSPKSQRLVIGG